MRIPRELIDEIIDELDLSEEYDPKIADALKSCALVSTLFVRSCQTRLFARISVRDYERTTGRRDETLSSSPHMSSIMLSYRLSVLLSTSPHLATYIRTLDLCYNASTTEANFVPRILSAVTALHTLILTDHFCASFPLNSSTVAVFSLPTLRRVELRRYQFANPFELESLLSRAKCLKELTLSATFFGENFEHDRVGVTREAGTASNVTLEKLTLVRVDNDVVKPMLDLFTMVDIRHLKRLSIHNSPIMDLLRVNAHFIQTLSLGRAYATVSYLSDVPDSQIMAGTNHLSCLNLEADEIHAVLTLLPLLGALENLTALKTVRITLHRSLDADHISNNDNDEWEQLDELLLPLPSGVGVEIYAAFGDFGEAAKRMDVDDVDFVKKCLPLLSNRETLRVLFNPRCERGHMSDV